MVASHAVGTCPSIAEQKNIGIGAEPVVRGLIEDNTAIERRGGNQTRKEPNDDRTMLNIASPLNVFHQPSQKRIAKNDRKPDPHFVP